jgi:hypothetical protein
MVAGVGLTAGSLIYTGSLNAVGGSGAQQKMACAVQQNILKKKGGRDGLSGGRCQARMIPPRGPILMSFL